MSGFSLNDRVKALNLGLTIDGDFDTGRVTVTGGRQTFVFDGLEQAGPALDLANYVVFNTLHKMTVGDGPIASLLAKLPRHAGVAAGQEDGPQASVRPSACPSHRHEEGGMTVKYEPVCVGMQVDVGEVSLEQAVLRGLGPRFAYTLTVSPALIGTARRLLKHMGADTKNHPMAPYINLEVCNDFGPHEWCVSDGEKAYGSKGV